MSRRYDEPVDVQQRDDVPALVLWRGAVWKVEVVLARWFEAGGWWRRSAVPTADDGEREYWRVEAVGGRARGRAVLDLCFDWSGGGWTVARALD